MMSSRTLVACALAATLTSAATHSATRLRTEYLDGPLAIDVTTPRFSWALTHPNRGEAQTSYHILVTQVTAAGGAGSTVWDSGVVASNKSLNVGYAGAPLQADSDFTWTVTWADSTGALSEPATTTFSTGLLAPGDWQGAGWVSAANESFNVYRASSIVLAAQPVRARLYISGLGYQKTWVNGMPTDTHELGQFVTFQQRVLYDAWDVTGLLRPGCNQLGAMLGNGWFSQPTIKAGPKQLRALLSVTTPDGVTAYYATAAAAGDSVAIAAAGATPLTFTTAPGPVLADDIYVGETYDGGVAAALDGWSTCAFAPGPSPAWVPAVAPAVSPATFGSAISAHHVQITTDRTFSVLAGGITQPSPGVAVFDFEQNMAGQTTLRIDGGCAAGTVITLKHAEILDVTGHIRNNFLPGAPMVGTYICAGTGGVEEYRTHFSYYGFRYVQLEGFPGVPGESAVAAHFVHSDVPQSGEFVSSSPLLNSIQHATRYASWSNLMDVPTDCPQRERRGWLGDAQLSFETVIHNVDGGAFYTKWLNDFIDTQVYDNATMGTDGALPDCIPFYGHGHPDSDPGWGIAGFVIPDMFSDYMADDIFDVAWYPHMRWYMEHWVKLAEANGGIFPLFFWGDWGNYSPGPYAFKTPEYPQYFFIQAADLTAKFAARLGLPADVQRYTNISASARALYTSHFYDASTGCFANCTYVSQLLALSAGLVPQGSAEEALVWSHAMAWFNGSAPGSIAEHFGGGIISLKLLFPLLDRFGQSGLGLRMLLQTDKAPGFGYWIETGGATTLWEQYNMDAINGDASRNHIMFGGSGSWYYSTLAGMARVPGSRSWANLAIAPPAGDVLLNLTSASASIDTSMGLVATSWSAQPSGSLTALCARVPENADLTLTCFGSDGTAGAATFSNVSFASFGVPSGSCATGFAVNPSCASDASVATVAAACVGKATCTIPATVKAFGGVDPCPNVVKSLAVVMSGPCFVPVYTLDTTIPVGSVATVKLPAGVPVTGSAVAVLEGTTVVWAHGAFVPGSVPGVTGATAGPDGTSVVFSVGSGTYSFQALAQATAA